MEITRSYNGNITVPTATMPPRRPATQYFKQNVSARIIHGLKLPAAVKAFFVKYSPNYSAFVATASQQLLSSENTLYPKFAKRWEECQDPLRWSTTAKKGFGKRCVRSWAARRLKVAFTESLRKKGYTRNGCRIGGDAKPLVGTAQFLFDPMILKTNHLDLVAQTDLTVEAMLSKSGIDKGTTRRQTAGHSRYEKTTVRPQNVRHLAPSSSSRSLKLS